MTRTWRAGPRCGDRAGEAGSRTAEVSTVGTAAVDAYTALAASPPRPIRRSPPFDGLLDSPAMSRARFVVAPLLLVAACASTPNTLATSWSVGRSDGARREQLVVVRARHGERELGLRDARLTSLTRVSCEASERASCDQSGVCRGRVLVLGQGTCVVGIEALTRGGDLVTSCQQVPGGRENDSRGCADWARGREVLHHQRGTRPGVRPSRLR